MAQIDNVYIMYLPEPTLVWLFHTHIMNPIYLNINADHLLLAPRSGSILGGTPVRVLGPCVQNVNKVKCTFDNQEVEGKYYLKEGQFVCVTPRFQKTGRVHFTLTFTSDNGEELLSSVFSVGELFTITIVLNMRHVGMA